MILQLSLGAALTLVSIMVSGLALLIAEAAFTRWRDWLRSPPHALRLFAVVLGTSMLVLADITIGVWLWTVACLMLGLFTTTEEALYFSLVAYTTLGYGDVLAPEGWRILGGMAAANGFINIGLLTTLLIEGLGHVRKGYRETMLGDEAD